MSVRIFLLGLIGATLLAQQSARSAVYDYEWNGDILPSGATPPWTSTNFADAATTGSDFASTDAALTNAGFLQLTTTTASQQRYVLPAGTGWNVTDVFDIEARIKLISSTHTSGAVLSLYAGNLDRRVILTIGLNSANASGVIITAGPTTYDPTDWTTYRLTGEKVEGAWQYNFFVNGAMVNAVPFPGQSSGSTNQIILGDASGSNQGGVSQWDYVHWSDSQIVPEPAAMGMSLLVLTGSGLAARRERRRS
jgi:hypothetical protein